MSEKFANIDGQTKTKKTNKNKNKKRETMMYITLQRKLKI